MPRCLAKHCDQTLTALQPPGTLFCPAHWQRIPGREKVSILAAWKRRDRAAYNDAVRLAVQLAARPAEWPRPQRCHTCHAPLYYLETAAGRPMPVDAASVIAAGIHPREATFDAKRHTTHFATCPHAAAHRRTAR